MLICGERGFAYTAQVENILARDYFDVVRREMGKATSSISVCMYSFTLRPHLSDSPVFALAQSLKQAHDRGVRVEVLLDQNIDFLEEGRGSGGWEGKNAPAYAFLKAQGIPVGYDDAATYLHSKVVVIDSETVILGSSNWTDAALNRNEETNVLVRSKEVARDVLAALHAIPRQEPLPNYDDAGVDVPGEFLVRPDLFGRMVSRKDDRAFDLYLYLLKEQSDRHIPPGSPFSVNHHTLAVALGIDQSSQESYRRQINRLLAKLQNLYGLIRVQTEFKGDSTVLVTDLPPGRSAHMPARYWTLGWDRRLSFVEKGFLLISQFESAVSSRRPRWTVAQKTLARRYGASPWFFSEGSTGLRRRNLLEAELAPFKEGPAPRLPTIYTPNSLYDPAELDKKMDALKTKYGPEKFERAQKAAALVFEDSDVNGIKELMDLEIQYGRDRVDAAVRLLGQKNPDNPLRTMAYLIGTIRGLNH